MGEEFERDFKGVWIEREVWLDHRLNALEKVILTEIDSLDSSEQGCWASNKHIAEFCQCSETKVSQAISKLVKLEYLYIQKFDGRQRELKSCLTKNARQNYISCEADSQEMQESNTSNNTPNNTESIKYIVDYLNEKIGTHYKAKTPSTAKHINARLNEGFTIEDFKTVIDKKAKAWLNTDMAKYLRPETLFAGKFEQYLNEITNNKGVSNYGSNQQHTSAGQGKYGTWL